MLTLKHLETICNDILNELVSADTDDFEYRMCTYEINFEEARINVILQKHHISWGQLTDDETTLVYKPARLFYDLAKHFGLSAAQEMLKGRQFDLPMYYI